MSNVSTMPSYIISRSPGLYGGNQDGYLEEARAIVKKTAREFHKSINSKKDLEELFHQTLATLADHRHRIAHKHHTNNPCLFGARRDKEETFRGIDLVTSLGHPYTEYNEKMLAFFVKNLNNMKCSPSRFQETEMKISHRKCLKMDESTTFSIITYEKRNFWGVTKELYEKLCQLWELISFPLFEDEPDPIIRQNRITNHVCDLSMNKGLMQKLREKSLELYNDLILRIVVIGLRQKFKGPKSHWIVVTKQLEVEDKVYTLSQYITWLFYDGREDQITQMAKESRIITIIHQDPFLIEPMLNHIAKIFKRALEWDGKNVKTLKNHVALLQYELAYAMPFARGSAAVSEWLEMSIFRSHGFDTEYNPKKMVNLEALTSSLSEFVNNYELMIELKKSAKPTI